MNKKGFIRFIGLFLMLFSFYFIVRRLLFFQVDYRVLMTRGNVISLITMPFISMTGIFCFSCAWRQCLGIFTDKAISSRDTFSAYAKSNVMKYLPGNVGHYAGRQLFGTRFGIKQMELVVVSLMEICYSAMSLGLFSLVFSASTVLREIRSRFSDAAILGALAALCAAGLVACVVLFLFRRNVHMAVMLRLIRSRRFWTAFLKALSLYMLGSIIQVMESVILLGQYVELDPGKIVLFFSASFAASFVGFITPGVPGGIGVREAVLCAILASVFPEDLILVTALTFRVIQILGDALSVPVSALFVEDYAGDAENHSNHKKEIP